MKLADVVETSDAVAATPSRREKIELVAAAVRALSPEEARAGIAFLCGEPRQRQVGVGYAALRELPAPADRTTLTVADVDETLGRIGGARGRGSQAERRRLLAELLARATEPEQRFLRALLGGGVRQGALDGIVLERVCARPVSRRPTRGERSCSSGTWVSSPSSRAPRRRGAPRAAARTRPTASTDARPDGPRPRDGARAAR